MTLRIFEDRVEIEEAHVEDENPGLWVGLVFHWRWNGLMMQPKVEDSPAH
jgi:hypothetical protein